jgi:hypothetical protein
MILIMRRTHILILLALAGLAILAYLPLLSQPLLDDDYPYIEMARIHGPGQAFANPVLRPRFTFWTLTYLLGRSSGAAPLPFYISTIVLHILCTWLVYALGAWRIVGWRVAAVAAAFFAVHEGHQEAVMWYSATPQTFQFLFGVAALVCWVRFIENRGGRLLYTAALGAFLLTFVSMETAPIFAALLLLPLCSVESKRRAALLWRWLPFAALAAVDAGLIIAASSSRGPDDRFSFLSPVWIALPFSYARLLWVWGLLGLITIGLLKSKESRPLILTALVWMPIALLPYSFLTYMRFVPSRHTYLASLGLSWIVGVAFWALYERLHRYRRPIAATVLAAVLAVNIGYLWTKKRRQYLERAAPTEALVALVSRTSGPIYMRCNGSPVERTIFEAAVRVRTGTMPLVWDSGQAQSAAAEFCWKRYP